MPGTAEHPTVTSIDLGIANAHLIYGERPILVDTGPADAQDKLNRALGELGIQRGALSLVVLTHGHADHAGNGAFLREAFRAPIALGLGDTRITADGRNPPLRATSIFARIIRPFVDDPFPPYRPDLEVETSIDLRPYGAVGQIIAMPGHTAGSAVVVLGSGDAFVGDLFAGGYLGGALFPGSPGTHYFHDEQAAAEARVCEVIRMGAKRLYLGHGGPVTADAARARFCAP